MSPVLVARIANPVIAVAVEAFVRMKRDGLVDVAVIAPEASVPVIEAE
jgi:hypothetical protein